MPHTYIYAKEQNKCVNCYISETGIGIQAGDGSSGEAEW